MRRLHIANSSHAVRRRLPRYGLLPLLPELEPEPLLPELLDPPELFADDEEEEEEADGSGLNNVLGVAGRDEPPEVDPPTGVTSGFSPMFAER